MNPLNFVAVTLKVLVVNLLDALNFVNVLKKVRKIKKNFKNVKKTLTKIKQEAQLSPRDRAMRRVN